MTRPSGNARFFASIYFAMQSSLSFSTERADGDRWPAHRRRQLACLAVYGLLVVTSIALAPLLSPEGTAAASGLTFPGAGFMHWAGPGQIGLCVALFSAAVIAFLAALVVWLATGNLLVPPVTWVLLAWLSAKPEIFGLDAVTASPPWVIAIGPIIALMLGVAWLRGGRHRGAAPYPVAAVARMPEREPAQPEELSPETLKRVRLLLDRALQPADRFDGFERRDQFQTAALRYQVNFMAYALAMVGRLHAPAAEAPYGEAQDRLLAKLGDHRLWRYWALENAWANFRLDGDPVARQNIMYSGFGLLQMALAERDALSLHRGGTEQRRYGLGEIAALLEEQYRTAAFGLLPCEPNWIYPLCNLITMAGIKAADARLGTGSWPALEAAFLDNLRREGMRPDGRFIAFRSSLTGIAPPAPGGVVMQAFPCLFLNALSPEAAQAQWHLVRRQLDSRSWKRLFWPIDTGNYGFSRASSYAATAAAAVEMGDRAVAEECLRRLEDECPSRELGGAIHRDHASLWAHALEIMARCGGRNAMRDLITGPAGSDRPRLLRISCPRAQIAGARSDGSGINLVLQPGGGQPMPAIELGGLLPGRHYHTGLARRPLLKADTEGRGVLRVPLGGRLALSLRPFAAEDGQWSAA